MTVSELTAHAATLEAQIAKASPSLRVSLQPKLERVLSDYRAGGIAAPRRLKDLNAELLDEVIEARFDNMPV